MAEDIRNVSPVAQSYENRQVNKGLSPAPIPYVTGLELKADISINGLTLNTIDSSGVVWVCTDIEGWWTMPQPEFPDLPRGWGDGSYDIRGKWGPRLLTLKGSFLTPDNSYVPAAREKLISALSLVYSGAWLKVNETPAKAAYVRLNGAPEISTVNARGRTDFSIGLKAGDPIKYEWYTDPSSPDPEGYRYTAEFGASSGGTTITINNTGNIKVPIRVYLTGTIAPSGSSVYKLENTTRQIPVSDGTTRSEKLYIIGTLNGASFEIDTYNKEILEITEDPSLPGVIDARNARHKMDVTSDWIYLDPGINTLKWTGSSSAAKCQIGYRSGWIG
jgi:hypothetical protein